MITTNRKRGTALQRSTITLYVYTVLVSAACRRSFSVCPRDYRRGRRTLLFSSASAKITSIGSLRGGSTDEIDYSGVMMKEDPESMSGGGAINEKKRTFLLDSDDPLSSNENADKDDVTSRNQATTKVFHGSQKQAHFLHAMEGLDRYPNYISRWSPEDAQDLEDALVQRLEMVRLQKETATLQRERILKLVKAICEKEPEWNVLLTPPRSWEDLKQSDMLDKSTQNAIFRSKFFRPHKNHTVPSIQEVLQGSRRVELDAGYLQDLMDEEMFDVYSFPLLSESFCNRIQAYIRRVTQELDTTQDPDFTSGGQRRVRNLDNIGLTWLNDLLFQLVVRPISRQLYQETEMGGEKGDLDWRHAFIAAYAADPDSHKPRQRLVPHTDDAEVTLNVCIGDTFEGGKLKFWGLRGTEEAGHLLGEYSPKRGRALLHAGRQLHEVTQVTSGDRFALIMWTRSWGGIRSTTCPCCWLNRRSDTSRSSCTCSARWN